MIGEILAFPEELVCHLSVGTGFFGGVFGFLRFSAEGVGESDGGEVGGRFGRSMVGENVEWRERVWRLGEPVSSERVKVDGSH